MLGLDLPDDVGDNEDVGIKFEPGSLKYFGNKRVVTIFHTGGYNSYSPYGDCSHIPFYISAAKNYYGRRYGFYSVRAKTSWTLFIESGS
jgi:hypothetical protein